MYTSRREIGSDVILLLDSYLAYVSLQAELVQAAGSESCYRLPLSASDRIGPLLSHIDRHRSVLGIVQYGISVTTLEEVFLKIDSDATANTSEGEEGQEEESLTVEGESAGGDRSGTNDYTSISTSAKNGGDQMGVNAVHNSVKNLVSAALQMAWPHQKPSGNKLISREGESPVNPEISRHSSESAHSLDFTSFAAEDSGMKAASMEQQSGGGDSRGDRYKLLPRAAFVNSSLSEGSSVGPNTAAREGTLVTPLLASVQYVNAAVLRRASSVYHLWQQVWILLTKRALYGRRDKKLFLTQLVLPCLLVTLGLLLLQSRPAGDSPQLELSPSNFNNKLPLEHRNFIPFYSLGSFGDSLRDAINGEEDGDILGSKNYMGSDGDRGLTSDTSSVSHLRSRSSFSTDRLIKRTDMVFLGRAVSINSSVPDQFEGCSQGAEPLHRMSNYLIESVMSADRVGVKVPGGGDDDDDDGVRGRRLQSLRHIKADVKKSRKDLGEFGSSRYGAVTVSEDSSLSDLHYNVLVNGSARHGAPIFINILHTAFLRILSNSSSAYIKIRNDPLPRTHAQRQKSQSFDAFSCAIFLSIALCFVPASFVAFVVKEREVEAKHLQVVSGVSLLSYWISSWLWDILSYLPTVATIELVLYLFSVQLYFYGLSGFTGLLLLLLYGPAAATFTYTLSYLFKSHSTAQTFIIVLNFIFGLCFMVAVFIMQAIDQTKHIASILRIYFRLFPSFCIADGLARISLCSVETSKCIVITNEGVDFLHPKGPLSYDVAGADLVFLAVDMFLYFGITLLIEKFQMSHYGHKVLYQAYLWMQRNKNHFSWLPGLLGEENRSSMGTGQGMYNPIRDDSRGALGDAEAIGTTALSATTRVDREVALREDEDEDVLRERTRVRQLLCLSADQPTSTESRSIASYINRNALIGSATDVVCLYNLRRLFFTSPNAAPKEAVHSLSFGIPSGECFGFLGVNGAGKSTTVSILTGQTSCSDGVGFIQGFDITTQQSKVRENIGLCPQFDALYDLLTVEEHIYIYYYIKKLPVEGYRDTLETLLKEFHLTPHRRKAAGTLSGGNKRKLSLLIAVLGQPPILFLDG